jgi:phosphate transport system substrate-binding protein
MTLRVDLFGRAAALLCAAALALGCSATPVKPGGSGATSSGGAVRLQGAGATFPAPLYQKWVSEFGKVSPNAQIDYQSTGSGAGVNQIIAGTVDFGASDDPVSDDDLKKVQAGELLHIPTVLGAVVLTYNLAGNPELRFSPEVIADIYLGKIKRWDDARLKADNPGAQLPAADITVVARADGSGTSAVFTDFLSKASPEWKEKVGKGKSPNWPTGQRAKGNEGVVAAVKQNPNTIGYTELVYAEQQKLPVALVRNATGAFVKPSLDSVAAAAASALAQTPEDLRVSITNAAGAGAYPIASYTYVLVYKEQQDAAKGKTLVDFLWWALHDGTPFARTMSYAPLPDEVRARAEAKLNSITSGGRPLRS